MITLQNSTGIFAGTLQGELWLPVAGSWPLTNLTYVATGTNAQVDLPVLRDGAVVVVDGAGLVSVVDGPDLIGASVYGFSLAIMTIGLWLGIRFAFKKALSGANLGSAVD